MGRTTETQLKVSKKDLFNPGFNVVSDLRSHLKSEVILNQTKYALRMVDVAWVMLVKVSL